MKKLVLFVAVIVAVSFASCGKKAAPAEEVVADSTAVVVDSAAADTAAVVDTTVAAQ
jgi:hypothetical protein